MVTQGNIPHHTSKDSTGLASFFRAQSQSSRSLDSMLFSAICICKACWAQLMNTSPKNCLAASPCLKQSSVFCNSLWKVFHPIDIRHKTYKPQRRLREFGLESCWLSGELVKLLVQFVQLLPLYLDYLSLTLTWQQHTCLECLNGLQHLVQSNKIL